MPMQFVTTAFLWRRKSKLVALGSFSEEASMLKAKAEYGTSLSYGVRTGPLGVGVPFAARI